MPTLADDVDLEPFVMAKDELSGADIKAIATEAGMLALRERRMKVTQVDFEKAKEKAGSFYLLTEIEKKLSWQYKRLKKWNKAVKIWEEMINENRGGLFPYIELAKYYEHQVKKNLKALKCTEKAITILKEKRRITTNYQEEKNKLEHRLSRLETKIE